MRRSRSLQWNPGFPALALGAIGLCVLLTAGGEGARRAAVDPVVRVRIEAKLEKLARPFDQPDAAEAFYQLKRAAPEGTDVHELYRAAREHMAGMRRYSIRRGDYLLADEPAEKAELETWRALGPGNIGGRTRALLIHPDQPGTMWAAGVSGGIWKTSSGGASWQPLADLQPNIAVNSMAMDPADPQVIYAGTGEGFFREVVRGTALPLRGGGIFRTANGGSSWSRLGGTASSNFYWVNDLAVSVNDSQRVYAATRTGVWRSNNSGSSWQRVLASPENGGCLNLALRTDRPTDVLFAGCGTLAQGRIYRNLAAESGGGWESVFSEGGMGRTSLAVAPSNQKVVYALAASYVAGPGGNFDGGLHAVFRSDQNGDPGTWTARVRNSDSDKLSTLILTNPVIANLQQCGFGGENFYSNLGWYTNVIAVDPTNPEVVWAGGVDLFRSDDGGSSWGTVSHWHEVPPSAHADQHAVVFHPAYNGAGNQTMFLAGDGGVYRTTNARAAKATGSQATCRAANTSVRWTALNRSYGVTQFYHGAPFPDGRRFLGGTQDNGTILGSDAAGINGWTRILGGDGGYVAVDPGDPDVIYAETQWIDIRKSTDGGASFIEAANGINENTSTALFITPFTMDPSDSRRLWTGGQRLWRTTDGAAFWSQASATLPAGGMVSAIAVDPSDPSHVLVGSSAGHILRNTNALATSASTNWPSTRPRTGFVTWLAIDPLSTDVAYATYAEFGGRHVWKSTDGGATWSPSDGTGTGRLPDIPVHSIAVDPTDTQRLFLGTDLGVFVSTDGGETWAVENTGFANAVTETLTLGPGPDGEPSLFAFTHGRGAWRVELAEGQPGSLQLLTDSFAASEPDGNVTITVIRTGGASGAVTVDYATGGGTATPGSDYGPISGTLTWADNDPIPKSFAVSLLDDVLVEGAETVSITLSNPAGGALLGEPSSATLTLADNDVAPGDCVPGDAVMCLGGGRFKVEITWRNATGGSGRGQVVAGTPADDSGLFWFFSAANWELLIKVLDGCTINDHFWAFFGATTDVGYTLTVTDTERGQFRQWQNEVGVAAPSVTETEAFATCPAPRTLACGEASWPSPASPEVCPETRALGSTFRPDF